MDDGAEVGYVASIFVTYFSMALPLSIPYALSAI
jgi:hypothetical protein